MKLIAILSLLLSSALFADDILVVSSGKINIAYVREGKVWTRACEDLAIVKKLNDQFSHKRVHIVIQLIHDKHTAF